MNNPDPVFIASAIATAVGAVMTIAQAVPSIDKRLGRLRDIGREVGSLPRRIRLLYVYPQLLYKYALLGITFLGILMVGAFLYRALYPKAEMIPVLERLKDSGVWLIGLWLVLGAAMYTNALSRLLIGIGLLLTWPSPIRRVLGIRRLDDHPAWPALNTFQDFNENARPIFISPANAGAFADWLIRTVRKETAAPPNRASPPTRPVNMSEEIFYERLGNALLTGCFVEQAHYRSEGFPRREWAAFYDAIGEIATQTSLLSAETVRRRHSASDYYDALFAELNRCLNARNQPTIPDSPRLTEALRSAFQTLSRKYFGTVVGVDPRDDGWLRSRSELIYVRVKEFSFWDSETMQAQFVKLAVVWRIWRDFPISEFVLPVTKRIAALLLDRGVMLAPEDLRVLTFDHSADRAVARMAEAMVVSEAIRLVEGDPAQHQAWLPPASRGTSGELLRWWIAYEVDFRLWDYATRLGRGEQIAGDPGLTRWQLSYSQVARVKKS